MTDNRVVGSCYCGTVRFEAELPTVFVAHCHCANCRRAHGAGFVTFAGFPQQRFHIREGVAELADYHTETGAVRSFCKTCGSTLTFRSPRWEGEVHVAVANFHGPLDRLPQGHAYADRAPDWCPIHDDLPRYGGDSGTEKLDPA